MYDWYRGYHLIVELSLKMATSNIIIPPRLKPRKYESWGKERKFLEMSTNVIKDKTTHCVFSSQTGKARESVLEMGPDNLNNQEVMLKLYAKLDKLFKVDANLSALIAGEKFEKYSKVPEINLADYQIEFEASRTA